MWRGQKRQQTFCAHAIKDITDKTSLFFGESYRDISTWHIIPILAGFGPKLGNRFWEPIL